MVKSDLSLYDRSLDRRPCQESCFRGKQVIRFWWKIKDSFFFYTETMEEHRLYILLNHIICDYLDERDQVLDKDF